MFNGIMIHGTQVDNLMFYGRGAGKLPTASAVVSDVIECAKNIGRNIPNCFDGLQAAQVSEPPAKPEGEKFRVLA